MSQFTFVDADGCLSTSSSNPAILLAGKLEESHFILDLPMMMIALDNMQNFKFSSPRILNHILFWVFILIYLTMSFKRHTGDFFATLYDTLVYLPVHIFLVYTLIYFLIPRYAFKKNFLWFSVGLIVAVGISILYVMFIDSYIFIYGEKFNNRYYYRALFTNFNVCGIAVAIKLFKNWYQERVAKQEAEKANLTAQLQLLRSQIHPHFLFNTLNNLYALTLEKSDRSPEFVLKLSALLRYMLYECNVQSIALEKEIETINTYIELEKFRYGNRLDLSVHYEGAIKGKMIPPLLLLPFLENSFKHGTSEQIDKCWMNLNLFVKGDQLFFTLINSVHRHELEPAMLKGIGLNNVQKRLDLLYGEEYRLKLLPAEDTYTVSLTLNLHGGSF